MEIEDPSRSRTGPCSEIQECEDVLLIEGEELTQEPPVRRAFLLTLCGLRRPVLDALLGFPDVCVRVRRLFHVQRLAAVFFRRSWAGRSARTGL